MTPEEKAEEVIKLSIAFWHGHDEAKALVVQAIRQAENEAYEKAAQLLLNGSFLHDDAPPARFAREAAPAIRSLKHP